MKEQTYQKADGSEGKAYKFEAGDKAIARFPAPMELKGGKFENWSIGVLYNDEEIYVQLTKAQAESLKKAGDIKDKTITAYEYENQYGKQVGVKAE